MNIIGAFALTLLIEIALAAVFFGGKRNLYAVFLCNLLTNPALNVIITVAVSLLGQFIYWPAVILLEILVFIAEAYVLRLLAMPTAKKAIAMSAVLNSASFIAGLIISTILG